MELSLDDDRYCIDIAQVDEIVDVTGDVTSIPNADDHIVGVVDLRGGTTTVVVPRVNLGLDGAADGERIAFLS